MKKLGKEVKNKMKGKYALTGILLTVFLIGVPILAFDIQPVAAGRLAIIHADGSITPSDAPIYSAGFDHYYLTKDCDGVGEAWQIQIERDNIVFSGGGHLLKGSPDLWWGINVTGRFGVHIRYMVITGWSEIGICLNRTSTCILHNLEMRNNYCAIALDNSTSNFIGNNIISDNGVGIALHISDYNIFVRNYITTNAYGMIFKGSSFNRIYCNTFNNTMYQVNYDITMWSENTWDGGPRYGGNYWSDYTERYPNATEYLGIWDTPYVVVWNDQDNYPLVQIHEVPRPPPRRGGGGGGGCKARR